MTFESTGSFNESRRMNLDNIISVLSNCILEQRGHTIYCVGKPGCGKSTVVAKALNQIKKQFNEDVVRIINAEGLAGVFNSSELFYLQIKNQLDMYEPNLKSTKDVKKDVFDVLEKTVSKRKKPIPMTILWIENIDMAPFDPLRDLMNLSSLGDSKVIIIGTGNKTLIPELNLKFNPIIHAFENFNASELESILKDRCYDGAVEERALQLISRKVVRCMDGDAKVALQMLHERLLYRYDIELKNQRRTIFFER
jgi:Cdc6-like AAA superfamily ATPase